MTASYMVGCDGAHSTVRHLLKLPFEGAEYDLSFMLADIETNDSAAADQLQLCPSEFGPLAIFPMSATRRRIVAIVEQREGDAPSLDLVRRMLSERAPAGVEARSIYWSSYFRVHHRHTARLRVGRTFVAGDAAHIHSPFGGQGMNTGLHDVWNLAWKLDLALRGSGNEMLLDSYEAERIPAIKRVIATTHVMTKVLGTPSAVAQALRNAAMPVVSRLPAFRRQFVQRLSALGLAYRGSPIVDGRGERYLDDSMRGGEGIRSRFLLFCGSAMDAPVQDAARKLAASMNDLVEVRMSSHPGLKLVRPDGYVAYSQRGADALAALKAVRALLERQTRQADATVGPAGRDLSHGERRPVSIN